VSGSDLVTEGGSHFRVTVQDSRCLVGMRVISSCGDTASCVDLTPRQARRLANRLIGAAAWTESLSGLVLGDDCGLE